MRRLFFTLYAAVAAAFVGFMLVIPWLLEHGLRGELLRSAEQISAGPQYFFEEELRIVPMDEWPAQIESLKSKFGYELALLKLDEVQASDWDLRRLRRGRVAFDEGDTVDFVLLPIRGSNYVVRVHIAQQPHEHVQRVMGGFYYLLEKQLARYPESDRTRALREIEKRFGYPLRDIALNEVAGESERKSLRSGEIVGRNVDEPGEHYFKRLGDGDRVLQIGPFPRYFLESAIIYLVAVMLAIFIAIAIYLWIRPLWRDMRALDQGAQAIGLGKLDAHVNVSSRSPVRALANTFNGMAQRVQVLLRTQKELADAVSHELRTPISRLRFRVEMLGRATSRSDHERYLQGILSDIGELEALVDEALTHSRLTNSAPRLSTQPVLLAKWLDEIMRDAQRSAGAIRLVSEIKTGSATASLDSQLMARALRNVIRNALRHARTTVRVTIGEFGGCTELIVEDDGPGIPPDRRHAIFEPFYRIDSSRQRESGGYGLGLAIVKRICEWHRTEVIVAESALGGALFRLRLPADHRSLNSSG